MSGDGSTWSKMGFVNGHGSTTEEKRYSFVDTEALSGSNYYRLRQVDLDGKEEFSSIIIVQCTENAAIRLYPNPVHTNLYIGDLTEPTDYIINGLAGQTLKRGVLSPGETIESLAFEQMDGLGDVFRPICPAHIGFTES